VSCTPAKLAVWPNLILVTGSVCVNCVVPVVWTGGVVPGLCSIRHEAMWIAVVAGWMDSVAVLVKCGVVQLLYHSLLASGNSGLAV
jgi:hypothetical protein